MLYIVYGIIFLIVFCFGGIIIADDFRCRVFGLSDSEQIGVLLVLALAWPLILPVGFIYLVVVGIKTMIRVAKKLNADRKE